MAAVLPVSTAGPAAGPGTTGGHGEAIVGGGGPALPVVVGVDGSPGADAALDVALDQAATRRVGVTAVRAWEPPEVWTWLRAGAPAAAALQREVRSAGWVQAGRACERRRRQGAGPVPVTVEVCSGPAGAVLERFSRRASLVVVGHGGEGTHRRLPFRVPGSVGVDCVRHAHCSVVVVRRPGGRARRRQPV